MTTSTVHFTMQGRIALLTLDNPPVNGIGSSVRQGLFVGVEKAMTDHGVDAIVLVGAGRQFCGGADIRQFNTPAASEKPMTRDVLALIAKSPKPVIAAIHGVALGGGLELALGCHYRVAAPDARLGLPEVNLGLIPGGGGTQRLPRLIGVAAALDIIVSGSPIAATRAHELGLINAVIAGELLSGAVDFARRIVSEGAALPLVVQRPLEPAGFDFDQRRQAVPARARNARAQHAAIDAVQASMQLPLEEGLTRERALFDELVAGPESKALRHMFFAEREAPRQPEAVADGDVRSVRKVAVLGAGTMGGGIAMAFANAGIPVVLLEREQSAIDRGLELVRRNYGVTVSKGKLSQAAMDSRMALIQPSMEFASLADVDLVIEAVFEDMAVKKDVFARLDAHCRPGAILATNTSRLSIDEIAQATSRPQDVVGLHFFSPANVMRLLEVVRGECTAPAVIAACLKMAQAIGKIPVLVRVCEGFVGNRMLTGYWREAGFLLEEGASPQQVDRAMTSFGMAMGPLAMADLAGMDINWAARKRLASTRPAHLRYSKVADRICEAGRYGQKTSAGYYRYEKGSRTPVPDPVVDTIIDACAAGAGIVREPIEDKDIAERCVLALVNEGVRILDEGVAQRASDIDVVYVHGYGFPASRGGPMFWAESMGLAHTLERIRALHATHGAHWVPAPGLVTRVEQGVQRFDDRGTP